MFIRNVKIEVPCVWIFEESKHIYTEKKKTQGSTTTVFCYRGKGHAYTDVLCIP